MPRETGCSSATAPAALLAMLLACSSTGCLFHPAREGLERLQRERGEPWAVTVFRRDPGAGERPLAELRETLAFWAGAGSRGEPRWKQVLVPVTEDLHARLAAAIDAGAASITLKAYRYDMVGLDAITLVDYLDERGVLLGSDHMEPPVLPALPGAPVLKGYTDLAWWEYPHMLLDFPVYLAIGLKELAGEIAKSPLSLISSGWIGPSVEKRHPLSPVNFRRAGSAFVEDWRNGLTALGWRFRIRRRHTPLDLLRDTAATVPVVGWIFSPKSPPESSAPPAATTLIALGEGIHMGGDAEQYITAWRRAAEEARPETIAAIVPYRYGSAFDTLWSMLNISQGMGHDLAARLVFGADLDAGDAVELVGFSGGAQRAVAATHALRHGGIGVNKLIGVAGPVAGSSCAAESTLLLAENVWDDPVVVMAHAVGFLFLWFPGNVRVESVPGGGGHHPPYLPDGATRAPHLGYARRFEGILEGDRLIQPDCPCCQAREQQAQ